ncbi:MAG TPA: hypothetical protein VIN59_04280 [Alphaproteobacteria bacterium]
MGLDLENTGALSGVEKPQRRTRIAPTVPGLIDEGAIANAFRAAANAKSRKVKYAEPTNVSITLVVDQSDFWQENRIAHVLARLFESEYFRGVHTTFRPEGKIINAGFTDENVANTQFYMSFDSDLVERWSREAGDVPASKFAEAFIRAPNFQSLCAAAGVVQLIATVSGKWVDLTKGRPLEARPSIFKNIIK